MRYLNTTSLGVCLALVGLAAGPVFAQSDSDQSADGASGQGMNSQSQTQGQNQNKNASGGQMAQGGQTSQGGQGGPGGPGDKAGSMGKPGKPMPGQGPAGHRPPPPPPAEPLANGNPLRHVCLNKSDAYSPGAVVTMNQKPYQCKAMGDDTSGVLHWVPMKDDS